MESTMSGEVSQLKERVSRWGIDRISELPDELIVHVLSFLPLKDAVATSSLSPRWLDLWKYIPNLIFINESFDEPMAISIPIEEPIDWEVVHSVINAEWVSSVLNSYKALSVKQLTISFRLREKAYHHVNKWLRFAFSRGVENLKLNLRRTLFVLSPYTLRGIRLSDCKFLKELTLAHLNVTSETIELLLCNCSQLERLIMNVRLTWDLMIRSTLLKYLEMYSVQCDGNFIKVFAPNLTQLRCRCAYEILLLEDVRNLVDASFFFFGGRHTMQKFAKEAAKLEILTITLRNPEEFLVPQMPKLKKLVVDYSMVSYKYELPITCVLHAAPYLEEFKFEMSDIEVYLRPPITKKAFLEIPEHEKIQHKCLKVFEFAGFCSEAPKHVELVTYIVDNCVALEEIIIVPICYDVACEFQRRSGAPTRFIYNLDLIAEERRALAEKKSTEQLLAPKIPHHIKLTIKNSLHSPIVSSFKEPGYIRMVAI